MFNNTSTIAPPPEREFKIKKGFTLAEVLVTLGIIGIVAALTMPSFINNYQKTVWTKQLQKSYATVQQGFKLMMAQEEVDSIDSTHAFQALKTYGCARLDGETMSNCTEFYNNLKKYFTITYIDDTYGNKKSSAKIYLADGSYIFGYRFWGTSRGATNSEIKRFGDFWIDVNGDKKPNEKGRDRFYFIVSQTGDVYAGGSKQSSLALYGDETTMYWKTNVHYANHCYGKGFNNTTCAGRVLEKGKMDY